MREYRNLLSELGISKDDIAKKITDTFNKMFYGSEDERI